MRLGISSYTFGWAIGVDGDRPTDAPGAIELIDRAAAMGAGVLQIADNLPAETYEPASVSRIAAYAREKGIGIEVGMRGCLPEQVRRFIVIATELRSPILRVVLDRPDDHPDEAEVVDRLGRVVADAEAAGITLAIENHDRFRSSELARMCQRLGSRVGICLDTVNSFGALEGPEVVVERLAPLAVNLHVKDFIVKRVPYLQGFVVEGRPAGEGMLNVPWLLERVRQLGRTDGCNAIAELWVPPEQTMRATIEKEAAWAAASVRALRQWIPK